MDDQSHADIARIEDVEQLEDLLSRPSASVVSAIGGLTGRLAILGAGGKMGPSLTRMACRARDAAGADLEIVAVSRFSDAAVAEKLRRAGAQTVRCDLLDAEAVADLPPADNVIYMVGLKFGTSGEAALTWATNALAPAWAARRYRHARIVAFSTGCVYDLVPVEGGGSVETDPLEPRGEYANSCVARERVLEYVSKTFATPMVLLRLNYAVEMRYGVLVDVASRILADEPVELATGHFNVIWQGEANAAALRLLDHTTSPPTPINVTGARALAVRDVARRLAELTGRDVRFTGTESPTAFLSNASRAHRLLGPPTVEVDRVLRWTADWLTRGGRTLGKPTHFETRDGRY